MRLKYLELQGYKTFAYRTDFSFDGGITAIVGPNGSGKSNIADAIRWVLGEQSYRSLRGKRTEDMIFSGSAQRARLGMASASLVLDNADGWLPIEFSEVVITRRAYRSGENEYLLNNRRSRLRDITELLSKSGLAQRTYTVIGQGLVDAVLSLRPDDRRALFEEASGISLYQTKRAEALSRLEETRANLLRVNDIVNEIAPRLRRLERDAERAERYTMLNQQLDGLLRTWYGYRWRQEQGSLRRTRAALSRRERVMTQAREHLEGMDQRMAALRSQQAQVRERLGGWHRESAELHRQMEQVQRDLAVWQERARLQARQRDELLAELAELEARAEVAGERIASALDEVTQLEGVLHDKQDLVTQAQAALDSHEAQRASLSQRLADAQAQSFDLATQAADRRNRRTQLQERRRALSQERDEHQASLADFENSTGDLKAKIRILDEEQARLHAERDSFQEEAARHETRLGQVLARQAELSGVLADTQRAAERLESRLELLTRLREEGEGLHAGVRAVLQARARRGSSEQALSGIIGTVAQLLHVPSEYEIAIEVALGGHLQDVVIESWQDAETAIHFLNEGQRGRATFLPLDTVKAVRRLDMPQDEGVVGLASDLVETDGRLAPVVEMLLGRTVVVHDLKAARRTFDQLRGGFQIVTPAGEILRSSGSVTGGRGKGQARGQVLAREREWRELPDHLSASHDQARRIEETLVEARADEGQVRTQISVLEAELQDVLRTLSDLHEQRQDRVRDLEQIDHQVSWVQGRISHLDGEEQDIDASEASLLADLDRLAAENEAVEGRVAEVEAKLEELSGEVLYQRLSEAKTEAALVRGTWQHRRTALTEQRRGQAQLQEQNTTKRQRIVAMEEDQASLATQIEEQISREAAIQGWLTGLNEKIEPAEAEIADLESRRDELDKDEVELRTRLRDAENRHAQAILVHSRQEDRLDRIRRQIMDDFGLVEMESTVGQPEQPPLPLGELVSSLPVVETLPEGLEEEIHQIKAQTRRMGSVNPNAPEEYAEVLDRHTFLTSQAADLEEAALSLREVIAELDEIMRLEFQATFKAVAERFKDNFTRLFGGGSARLVLTEPDDVTVTGVEVVARPPGKRQQTLALLSGGERSLTAVALIFAILEVSPPPFCILDEVDAMLDEANVRRFRQALRVLAERTQFIIITHNRGTIQVADTIYGVSMGDDSVSQVVSLRMEGDRIAAPDGSTVDVMKAG